METTAGAPDERIPSGTWRFGQVVLDEALAQLRVDGQPVDLDRSSYDVLLALLRHAGEVVTKDELLEAGWPGRVVSENSLAKAISRLRQALGPDGEAIRVVHGYGYRLTAAVQLQPASGPLLVHPEQSLRLREGDPVPHRPGWRLQRRLGAGSSGVIFLASSQAGESHAFKFADGEAGLHGIKREIALTRYIHAVKADLPDVARVLDWNLRQPPFFVELPYFEDGHLADWAAARGGLSQLELGIRLSLCASLCDTVAGLHEIGVIHKDLKPENLYPHVDADGRCRMVLSDLGAGEAALSPRLAELGLTFTLLGGNARAGSLLYLAPEVIAGDEPTLRSDVFALGVLLYQLVVGNLRRPLAPGWESDVEDPLLREDIALAAASNPERRQIDARTLAEHLRSLDARRAERARHQQERALAQQREQALVRERSRRRLWLTAATVASLGLVGTLGMYAYAEKARRVAVAATARADQEAAKARGVADFLVHDLLGQADMNAAQASLPSSLRQAVDRAAKAVDTRFAGNADVAADVHGALGAAYVGINLFGSAASEYARQARLLRGAVAPDRAAIANAQSEACLALIWAADTASSVASCEQARNDLRAAGQPSERVDVNIGLLDTRLGRNRQALARLAPAASALHRKGIAPELHTDALWFTAIAYGQLGLLPDEERAYRETIASMPGQAKWRTGLAMSEHGRVLLETGKTAAGLARLAESSRILSSAMGPDHAYAQDPVLQRMRYDSEIGDWTAVRRRAEPAYRDLLRKIGFESRTVRAGFLAMAAHAKAGDARAARRIMAELDVARARYGGGEDLPYLRVFRWQAYATAHIALGEFAAAEAYLDKLRALSSDPDAGRLTGARADCLQAELDMARGETTAALANARSCRTRILVATSPGSPLLGMPDRLLAALGEKP